MCDLLHNPSHPDVGQQIVHKYHCIRWNYDTARNKCATVQFL